MPPQKKRKVRPALQTAVSNAPHPSFAPGHAYSQDFRSFTLWVREQGWEGHELFEAARGVYFFPSEKTVDRHETRDTNEGHFRRYRWTGNNRATVLRGRMSFYLAYYRLLFPKVRHDEINAFLYYVGGMDRLYVASQISRAEDRIGLSTKVGSTTAFQAYTPRNLQIRRNYWTAEFPFGMVGIRRRDLIDIDEFGAFVEMSNRTSGKARVGRRVREIGPYNHSSRLNVMMSISGEEATADRVAPR